MLARSGRLPTRGSWAYEVKWDGFRAIVSTEGPLRVRSRRGCDMAPQLGFLAELPVRAVIDGELVAFGTDGKPDFERVCECMLQRHDQIPLTFLAFKACGAPDEGRDDGLPQARRCRLDVAREPAAPVEGHVRSERRHRVRRPDAAGRPGGLLGASRWLGAAARVAGTSGAGA